MTIQPSRILWPTDFSQVALHAARYARGFAERFGAAVHAIHVVPPPLIADLAATVPAEAPLGFPDEDTTGPARDQLEQIAAAEFGRGESVTCAVLLGSPWSAICDYARRNEIDLLVVSTHGRTGLPHAVIGSTAERIVQHAPCPVLVVKQREREFLIP